MLFVLDCRGSCLTIPHQENIRLLVDADAGTVNEMSTDRYRLVQTSTDEYRCDVKGYLFSTDPTSLFSINQY